jgi:Flp pilus assembly pilin Flp
MLSLFNQMVLAVVRDRKGISSLEYGVLAVGIVAVVAAAAVTLGGKLTTVFTNIGNAL